MDKKYHGLSGTSDLAAKLEKYNVSRNELIEQTQKDGVAGIDYMMAIFRENIKYKKHTLHCNIDNNHYVHICMEACCKQTSANNITSFFDAKYIERSEMHETLNDHLASIKEI